MDPLKAMEDGKKANREMIDLFRSLPKDCYSIELMENIISMPMWCVDNNDDNLDVCLALYDAYEFENQLDDPAYFEKINKLFQRALSIYTYGPKKDKMRIAAYEWFKHRSNENPEEFFNAYINLSIETMNLRHPDKTRQEQYADFTNEMREGYAEKPEQYKYWLGYALVESAEMSYYESDRIEDKEKALEELKKCLEPAIDFCKTNDISFGASFDPRRIYYQIIRWLTELGKKEELIQHYRIMIELTSKANADTINAENGPRYSDMYAKAMLDLSKALEETSPEEAESYFQNAQKYIQDNNLEYLLNPTDDDELDYWDEAQDNELENDGTEGTPSSH